MSQSDSTSPSAAMPDAFDRLRGSLEHLPGVYHTKPSTLVLSVPLLGTSETFIVETWRQRDEHDQAGDEADPRAPSRDTIFLQHIGRDRLVTKIAIPAAVADVIARQRDALGTKVRKRVAKRLAAQRKADGIKPAFLKKA